VDNAETEEVVGSLCTAGNSIPSYTKHQVHLHPTPDRKTIYVESYKNEPDNWTCGGYFH
jgi:hypothetical protein